MCLIPVFTTFCHIAMILWLPGCCYAIAKVFQLFVLARTSDKWSDFIGMHNNGWGGTWKTSLKNYIFCTWLSFVMLQFMLRYAVQSLSRWYGWWHLWGFKCVSMCFVSVDACRGFALIVGSLGGCDIIWPLHHLPLYRSHLEFCISLDTSLINNGERGGVGGIVYFLKNRYYETLFLRVACLWVIIIK